MRLTPVLMWLVVSSQPLLASEPPLTIAASSVGRFSRGNSWHLSINSAGKAELTIEPGAANPELVRRQFEIPADKLAEFRKAVDEAAFFDLKDEYGELVPDGSTDTLTIVAGDRAHSVKLHFLMNWVRERERDKLIEPARAVRLMMMVRGWSDDPTAVDQSKYDQRVLEAVGEKKAVSN